MVNISVDTNSVAIGKLKIGIYGNSSTDKSSTIKLTTTMTVIYT